MSSCFVSGNFAHTLAGFVAATDLLYRIYQIKAVDANTASILSEIEYLKGEADRLARKQAIVKQNWREALNRRSSTDGAALMTLKDISNDEPQFSVEAMMRDFYDGLALSDETTSDGSKLIHVVTNRIGTLPAVIAVVEEGFGDIYAIDLNGRTPLHCACVSGTLEAIKYLVYHGSDPTEPDRFGKLPLDFARSRADDKIIQFMESITTLYKSSTISPQALASRENRLRSASASKTDIEENITLPVLRTMKQIAANSSLIVLPEDVTPGE